MTKLTFTALFAAALLLTAATAPAMARSAHGAAQARQPRIERKAPPAYEAARAAFLQSLAQEEGKPAKPSLSPFTPKLAPVVCTGDGGMTTCCGPCGCCTWTGMGDGAHCASHC